MDEWFEVWGENRKKKIYHSWEMLWTTRNETKHVHTKFEDKHKYKGITLQKRPGLTDQEQRTNGPVNLFLY